MRICNGLLCDNAATVWWHGAWCAACCDKQFGRVPMFIGELEMRETSPSRLGEAAAPVRRPLRTRVEADPSSEAASPAPLTDYDLERLLATNGWDLMDIEWMLVDALDGDL